MRNSRLLIVAAAAAVSFVPTLRAAVTADRVVDYTPGDFTQTGTSTAYQNAATALGPLAGDTGFGGLNPFNPPFSTGQLVGIGAGGQLTLHLSSPVPTAGGPTLGVFSNNGIIDVSADGSGQAGVPPALFDDPDRPMAIVSVSADGLLYVPLNGGAPITFANPTNYYLDSEISGYYQPLGTVAADQGKPFTGTLDDLSGETYDQIKATLAGSAGGTWLDASASGLPVVNDVRFTVPAGAGYRLLVDSVSAVPEPASMAAVLLIGGGLLVRRGRR